VAVASRVPVKVALAYGGDGDGEEGLVRRCEMEEPPRTRSSEEVQSEGS
jgi:hypothetical protein